MAVITAGSSCVQVSYFSKADTRTRIFGEVVTVLVLYMLDKHKQERLDRTSMLETEHAAATKWPVLLRGTYRSPSCEAKQTGLLLPQDFIPQRTRELAGFFLLFPIRFFSVSNWTEKKFGTEISKKKNPQRSYPWTDYRRAKPPTRHPYGYV